MIHRFLHLSDIHFGQENKDGSLVKHDHVREGLAKDVSALATQRGAATRILVTGDIAFSGKSDEYQAAALWLETLAKACKCEEMDVSTIPGNHDCDLNAVSHQAKMLYAQLRESTPELVQAQLHAINADGENASPFLPKLNAYRQFANGFGCGFESPARPMWVRDFDLPGGIKLRFHGLTSVQVSDKADAVGKMILGNRQYIMGEDANVINIVLCHHPLDWFIDEVEAGQFLHNNARVIMVGHEHSLNIQKTVDVFSKKECLVIFAGATNPAEAPVYDYTYNWLELSCIEENGLHYLVVEVFPRIWVQPRVRFEADRSRLGGAEESVKVRILCQNLQPVLTPQPEKPVVSPAQNSATIVPANESSPALSTTASIDPPISVSQSGSPMNTNSTEFDRLRYLFWRYLDWRQRLKVLVDVDALPHTADQPVPQTLERIALENAAQNEGALHDLWDAVMLLIPAEKRSPNPFPPKTQVDNNA